MKGRKSYEEQFVTGHVVALWGFAFGTVPGGWPTWLLPAVPDEAESGSRILVAAIQLAISAGAGAAVGSVIFDRSGVSGAFTGSRLVLLMATLMILHSMRSPLLQKEER
jgi:predicted MFS family arabinose efflux permease